MSWRTTALLLLVAMALELTVLGILLLERQKLAYALRPHDAVDGNHSSDHYLRKEAPASGHHPAEGEPQ